MHCRLGLNHDRPVEGDQAVIKGPIDFDAQRVAANPPLARSRLAVHRERPGKVIGPEVATSACVRHPNAERWVGGVLRVANWRALTLQNRL